MKRNGPEWTGEKNIFQNILKEVLQTIYIDSFNPQVIVVKC